MFELSFVKKYLTPRRKQLSVSLIALLSAFVITLVVWLVVLFLSVTEGIEKNWQSKLTALNAPLRLSPTDEYFTSYYYNVDRYSEASHYMAKTIGQKARSLISDPYNPEIDESLPLGPAKDIAGNGNLKDPVKGAVSVLDELKLTYQDVELSGALLRLEMLRQDQNGFEKNEMKSQLTNVSFLASFAKNNPEIDKLLLPPTAKDLNQLLYLGEKQALEYADISEVQTASDLWSLSPKLLPEGEIFKVQGYENKGEITHLLIPNTAENKSTLERRGNYLFYKKEGELERSLDPTTPIFSYGTLSFKVLKIEKEEVFIEGKLQGHTLKGKAPFQGLKIKRATFQTTLENKGGSLPPWPYKLGSKLHLPKKDHQMGIVLAKSFQDSGVCIGDSGYLGYTSQTLLGTKEVQLPVFVSGFYDPGIMAVGNKCILVPKNITSAINASESAFTLEKSASNAIYVWFKDLNNASKIKQQILEKLHALGIDKYWKVETFKEYDFAKDLLQQFQSDKYLFTLVGVLILLVACTNIISLLILLVSDRKKEIGILRAMGASKRSVASIFAFSGASIGLFSCLLGVLFAFLTLKNIDHIVHFLSFIQGHDAFNAQFFGKGLPKEMSSRALLFALLATPVLSLLAGLIPAVKAASINPSESLRS